MKAWIELTEVEQAGAEFSDFYKEVHGFRPRHIDTSSWTMADFDREFQILAEQAKYVRQQQERAEAFAADKFERRMLELLESGAKDRAMALRWIHEAEQSNGDNEYLCFVLGLPYRYFN